MSDRVHAAIEADGEDCVTRIYDDEGKIEAGTASFRFSLDGIRGNDGCVDADKRDTEHTASTTREDIDSRYIAPLDTIPDSGTLRCEAINGQYGVEIILLRDETTVSAWRNSCPHKPDVRLDQGSGAIVTDDHVVCHKHGARFEQGDGDCTYGPCRGDALETIEVSVQDGDVYLTDDRFEACRRLA